MSHFTVLLIGGNIEQQLQPFHEYECTGKNDQYVVNVDQLAEARADYEKQTVTRFKAPDGQLFDSWDDRFFREPTPEEVEKHGFNGKMMGSGGGRGISYSSKDWGDGQGYRAKIHFKPEGFEEVELKKSEVMSFIEFIDEWYERPHVANGEEPDVEGTHAGGWVRLNDAGEVCELVDRTNPNARWDWWTVGGRWTGFFKLKPDTTGTLGEGGTFHKLGMVERKKGHVADSARKGDIDFDGMRAEAAKEAGEEYDKAAIIINGRTFLSWKQCREQEKDVEKAREFYHAQEVIKDLRKEFDNPFMDMEQFQTDRATFMRRAENNRIQTHAVVKDGQWHERGKMGWWACVSDEVSDEEWSEKFRQLLDELPDDTLLTVVDCHI